MSSLLDLADRCERAEQPDREIDLAIHLALWPDSELAKMTMHRRGLDSQPGFAWTIHQNAVVFERWTEDGRCPYNGGYPLPAFTGSVDAALSLKAEDIDLDLSYSIILIEGKAWFAELTAGGPYQTGFWPKQGRGYIGATAICAAALRAHSRDHVGSPADERGEA